MKSFPLKSLSRVEFLVLATCSSTAKTQHLERLLEKVGDSEESWSLMLEKEMLMLPWVVWIILDFA